MRLILIPQSQRKRFAKNQKFLVELAMPAQIRHTSPQHTNLVVPFVF